MNIESIGFIGAGRAARIIIGGLRRASALPEKVVASDRDEGVLKRLLLGHREVVAGSPGEAARQDVVFLAVPFGAMAEVLGEIRNCLQPDTVIVSLAPKVRIDAIMQMLGGFERIVRMTPNAPSIVRAGYNPVVFSKALSIIERERLKALFEVLGDAPEVPEEYLEAFSVITAMSPTYLWFQLETLKEIGRSFGLGDDELSKGISKAAEGAVKTLFSSGLSPEEVMDLVPVKPLGEDEEQIRVVYRIRLEAVYRKLKG